MLFEPHEAGHGFEGAFEDFNETDFCKFICDNSVLRRWNLIGKSSRGRPIFLANEIAGNYQIVIWRSSKVRVLGVNSIGNDHAIFLIDLIKEDIFAISLERITRIKHDKKGIEIILREYAEELV